MGKDEWEVAVKPARLKIRTYRRHRIEPSRPVRGRSVTGSADAATTQSRVDERPFESHAQLPQLQLARSDHLELGDLTTQYRGQARSPAVSFLERELSRARVVDDWSIAPNVATLRSQVVFHDAETGRDWVVTLGHPKDFVRREDAISVLSPLGAALIGLSEGQSIEFQTAEEKSRRVALVRVLCQPSRFGSAGGRRL